MVGENKVQVAQAIQKERSLKYASTVTREDDGANYAANLAALTQ
jgi:hypothetical protein